MGVHSVGQETLTLPPVDIADPSRPTGDVPDHFPVDWACIRDNPDIHAAAEYFFRHCFWTRDETARGSGKVHGVYKRYPWDKRPDCRAVVSYCLSNGGLFEILGSRRILKTWTMIGLTTFLALRHEGRMIPFGSTKEDRADMNLQRVIFVMSTLEKLDTSHSPRAVRRIDRSPNTLDLNNGSHFLNLTQSLNDLTQITASLIWQDEFSKINDDMKARVIRTGLPATQVAVGEDGMEGGGMYLTATCEGEERYWEMFFSDDYAKAQRVSPYDDANNEEGLRCPENGLRMWSDGDVHKILWYYFADPGKCPGTDWYKRERRRWIGNEEGWMREMEIWPVMDNVRRVTPMYNDRKHRTTFDGIMDLYVPNQRLIVAWDIGSKYQSATVLQCNPKTRRIIVPMELYEDNRDLEGFCRQVIGTIKQYIPSAFARHVGDARTLAASTATVMGDMRDVMYAAGVECDPAPVKSIQFSIDHMKRVLGEYLSDGEPRILIAGDMCPRLIAGLRGKYQYSAMGMVPKRDGVTEHVMDSFKLGLLEIDMLESDDDREDSNAMFLKEGVYNYNVSDNDGGML
jgi:hypothetical protein